MMFSHKYVHFNRILSALPTANNVQYLHVFEPEYVSASTAYFFIVTQNIRYESFIFAGLR